MESLRLALLQFDPSFEDTAFARARVAALTDGLSCDLLVLPEMTLSGFSMDPSVASLQDSDLAWYESLARRLGCGIVFGAVEEGRNVAILLGRDGARLGTYAKRHLFSLGGESRVYLRGSDADVWTFEGWTILPAICYDLRFAYHFWERAAEADLVLVPANWPCSRREHWRSLLQARAIENQVPVAGCNRVGRDAALAYCGDSLVFDAQGRILADAGDAEGLLTCVVEREHAAETRRRFPFLGDRLA
jgi:predicted amidohydrolase